MGSKGGTGRGQTSRSSASGRAAMRMHHILLEDADDDSFDIQSLEDALDAAEGQGTRGRSDGRLQQQDRELLAEYIGAQEDMSMFVYTPLAAPDRGMGGAGGLGQDDGGQSGVGDGLSSLSAMTVSTVQSAARMPSAGSVLRMFAAGGGKKMHEYAATDADGESVDSGSVEMSSSARSTRSTRSGDGRGGSMLFKLHSIPERFSSSESVSSAGSSTGKAKYVAYV